MLMKLKKTENTYYSEKPFGRKEKAYTAIYLNPEKINGIICDVTDTKADGDNSYKYRIVIMMDCGNNLEVIRYGSTPDEWESWVEENFFDKKPFYSENSDDTKIVDIDERLRKEILEEIKKYGESLKMNGLKAGDRVPEIKLMIIDKNNHVYIVGLDQIEGAFHAFCEGVL